MNTLVRVAGATDWPAIEALQSEARESLETQRGGPEWLAENVAHAPSVVELAAGSRTTVACIDEVVVGWCHSAPGNPRLSGLVDWIYVTPEARELGFGEELLNDAIDAARAAGAVRIESCALPGDRETKNMFERFGMKARLLVVGMSLLEPASAGDPGGTAVT